MTITDFRSIFIAALSKLTDNKNNAANKSAKPNILTNISLS